MEERIKAGGRGGGGVMARSVWVWRGKEDGRAWQTSGSSYTLFLFTREGKTGVLEEKCSCETLPTVTEPLEVASVQNGSDDGLGAKTQNKIWQGDGKRCTRQVPKERASEHSVSHSSPKRPFLATALGSLGRPAGGRVGAEGGAGPAQCEKRRRRKVGIGPEEKGVGATGCVPS